MDKKIISKYRYNTVTKTSRKKKEDKAIKLEKQRKANKVRKNLNISKPNISKNNKDFSFSKTLLKVIILVTILILIAFISKKIFKFNNNFIQSVFSSNDSNAKNIANYDFKIGLNKIDNYDLEKTSNIVVNEILKYSNLPLLTINSDYSINYKVALSITKINDVEYEVILNKNHGIKSDDVSSTINEIKSLGDSNIYYGNVKNISSIEKEDDYKFKIKLKVKDPYIIYDLNFPLYKSTNFSNLNLYSLNNNNVINKINPGNIRFDRNDSYSKSILNSITISNYDSSDDMVADFRDDKIDMFSTSSYNDMQLIGKHEYNIKKYRNGEGIFIFGNKNSKLFNIDEVRKALAYSINRDEIVKNNIMIYSEVIDLPYIYSDVKYKYDITGANNILLSNGWKKQNDIFNKNIDGQNTSIELNLIVNQDDSLKSTIADNICDMAAKTGIKINVEKLSPKDLNNKVESGDYDIVIASVNMNENPNIDYISNYLDINDKIKNVIDSVNVSNVENLSANIKNLQNVLSDQVACIGILAKDTNVIYQKQISGFEDICYMNIFKNIEKIEKSQ